MRISLPRELPDPLPPSPSPSPSVGGASVAGSLRSSLRGRVCDVVLAVADRNRRWVAVGVLLVYLLGFNGQWRMQPDAALYLSIGRNLATGHGFSYLGQPNRLAYPGWPALIALMFELFGGKSLVPVHALMLLISLATLAAVYRLILLVAGRQTAVVVAAGTGITKAFFCYGFELWTDMPFALGAVCFFAGIEGSKRPDRRWYDVALAVGGLTFAMATRPTGWPLLAAAILAAGTWALRRRPGVQMLLATVAAVAMVVAALAVSAREFHFGGVYEDYAENRLAFLFHGGLVKVVGHNVYLLLSAGASDVLFQVRMGLICNALLGLGVIALGANLFRVRPLWGYWFCLLLATILLSQDALDRYFLPVLPLLVFGWWTLLTRVNRSLPILWGNAAFLFLACFGGAMNVTKVGGIVVQQHTRPFLATYDKGAYQTVPEFAEKLHAILGENAIVYCRAPYGRVTAFLSGRSVMNQRERPLPADDRRPIFVVEPLDHATTDALAAAGRTVGPALFTVDPPRTRGELATPLSLHRVSPAR